MEQDPLPSEMLDDLRAHVSFCQTRASQGVLVLEIPLDGSRGPVRRWRLRQLENAEPRRKVLTGRDSRS